MHRLRQVEVSPGTVTVYLKQSHDALVWVSISDAKEIVMETFGFHEDWNHLKVKVYVGFYEIV